MNENKLAVTIACALCLARCVSPEPYAIVVIEDPTLAATEAHTLLLSLENSSAREVALEKALPVSVSIVAQGNAQGVLVIEARDEAGKALARGRATVRFSSDTKRSTTLSLGRACDALGECDDQRSCNGLEVCDNGACVDGVPPAIDDGNPCTTDSCSETIGVANVALADATLCTTPDISVGLCLSAVCTAGRCGDGYVTGTETCDDGANDEVCDGCDASCRAIGSYTCGDGYVCGTEQCDDGDANTLQSCLGCCRATCTRQRCGDGVMDPGEACDDGNNTPWDGCAGCVPDDYRLFKYEVSQFDDVCYSDGGVAIDPAHGFYLSVECDNCLDGCSTNLKQITTPSGTIAIAGYTGEYAKAFGSDGRSIVPVSVNQTTTAAYVYDATPLLTAGPVTLVSNSVGDVVALDSVFMPDGSFVFSYSTGAATAQVRVYSPSLLAGAGPTVIPGYTFLDGASPSGFYVSDSLSAQRYGIDAGTIGSAMTLTGVARKGGIRPDVEGGTLAVTCAENATFDVLYQRFDPSGGPLAAAQQVPETTGGNQRDPVVDVAADGSFVVAWSAPCGSSFTCPWLRTFGPSGTPTSPDVRASRHRFSGLVTVRIVRFLPDGTVGTLWFVSGRAEEEAAGQSTYAYYGSFVDGSFAIVP